MGTRRNYQRTSNKNDSPLHVLPVAEKLIDYTLDLTDNAKRFPKRVRFSITNKIQGHVMAIYDGLLEANEIFPIRTEADRTERLRLQRAALTECKKLLHMIELSKKRSYLDVPIGKIRDMAADGQITSTIVKNAMLASADEINAKFEAMPMTFAQVWTIAKNIALKVFTPVIQAIGSGAQWIYDNWSTIAPIFWGLASAALAYAVALGIQTAATWIADGAAKAFFTTLLTNPLFWIALAVGVVVAALYRMIQAVGGVKNAWEICKAALVVAWAALKVAFFATYNWIANLIDKLKLCWQRAGVAIAGYMGDMKVNVLTILQNMVNGAIDIINKFIGLLNKIPGVSIDAVEQVTFATTAKAENEAAKQARADALNKYESDIKAAQAQRDATYSAAKKELADATAALSKTYANAKAEAAQAKSDVGATDWNVDGTNDVGKVDSVGSVGKIDSDVNIADEDLKFLRDVAEMRYVQNFVTLTPTVAVEAQISEKVDVDEVVERIESKLEDEFTAAAEGVYN